MNGITYAERFGKEGAFITKASTFMKELKLHSSDARLLPAPIAR